MENANSNQKSSPTSLKSRTVSTPNLRAIFSQQPPEPVTFVSTIINEGVNLLASDILLEPGREYLKIRARIDGVLYELGKIGLDTYDYISSRIKVLSKLDPTEKRRIQEGQFSINHEGRTINLRVEVAHIIYGELIVIRVHEKKTIVLDLAQLGFSDEAYQKYEEIMQKRSGLVLVCGPTGCGKTTTIYSTISQLSHRGSYNIMTIEDPVEFQLEEVNQMQTKKEIDFDFAKGLRTILRLSPDIIFVGEIRDKETAEIAVESGLTGQLVLSTVHAEDSVGTLLRLLDLGIESYLLNSSLRGVVAQRLVRRICPTCQEPHPPSPDEIEVFQKVLGRQPERLVESRGCSECNQLGYRGRIGIFEVLKIDPQVRDLLRKNVNEDELRQSLRNIGFSTLLMDGLEKCEAGITTVGEVLENSIRTI